MLIPKIDGVRTAAAAAPPAVQDVAKLIADPAGAGKQGAADTAMLAPATAAPAADELREAVTQGNRAMAAMATALMFEIDADTKATVVKIVDTTDNSVLRQIPSQEMLQIAKALDRLQGLLVRDKA